MIWRSVAELDEAQRARLASFRCPVEMCSSPTATRLSFPETVIVSPLVSGGELQAIDCGGGHRTIPGPVGHGVYGA